MDEQRQNLPTNFLTTVLIVNKKTIREYIYMSDSEKLGDLLISKLGGLYGTPVAITDPNGTKIGELYYHRISSYRWYNLHRAIFTIDMFINSTVDKIAYMVKYMGYLFK
jgi:hypothetical protein